VSTQIEVMHKYLNFIHLDQRYDHQERMQYNLFKDF